MGINLLVPNKSQSHHVQSCFYHCKWSDAGLAFSYVQLKCFWKYEKWPDSCLIYHVCWSLSISENWWAWICRWITLLFLVQNYNLVNLLFLQEKLKIGHLNSPLLYSLCPSDIGKIETRQLNTADKIICTSINDWKQCPKCYLLQVFIKYALF